MIKKGIYLFLALMVFTIGYSEVYASSGKLRGASIKTCNGITYGQHSSDNHWHVAEEKDGSYYATGDALYSDPCESSIKPDNNSNDNTDTNNNSNNNANDINTNNNTNTDNQVKEESKSDDNTLKSLIIENKTFKEFDDIEFTTSKKSVEIKVVTNDEKAKYVIKDNSTLSIGKNVVTIEVTAENGTLKTYIINIIRETILSSDVGIKLIIDNEEIKFVDNKATVYASSSASNITIDYTLNDEHASVEMNKINKLETGNNILKIKVTAEDGTEQLYEVTIYKYGKFEETISIILAFAFLGGIGYGIYYVIKKVKNKKNK